MAAVNRQIQVKDSAVAGAASEGTPVAYVASLMDKQIDFISIGGANTYKIQGSDDNVTYYDIESAITAVGIYPVGGHWKFIRVVTTVYAAGSTVAFFSGNYAPTEQWA